MFSTTYDTLEYLLLRARMFIIETQRRVTTREETNEHLGVDFRSFPKLRFRWWPWCWSQLVIIKIADTFSVCRFRFGGQSSFSAGFLAIFCNAKLQYPSERWLMSLFSPVCNFWYLAVNRIDFKFLELSSFIIKLNRLDWPVRWVIIFRFSPL